MTDVVIYWFICRPLRQVMYTFHKHKHISCFISSCPCLYAQTYVAEISTIFVR